MFGFNKQSRSFSIDDLETEIEKYKITTLTSVEYKEVITKALSWLLNQQNPNGSWGNENQTFTALALIVLKRWEQIEISPYTSLQIKEKCELAVKWFKECFNKGWGTYPQIWIRSLALYSVGLWQNFDDACNNELNRLIKETTDSLSTDNAHHYSRLLILFNSQNLSDYKNQIAPSYSEFILSMTELNNYSQYYLSEIILGYKALKLKTSEECENRINNIIDYLEKSIEKFIVDSWSFVPYCATIIALGQEEREKSITILKDNYFKIFRSGGQRVDGSFYSDIAKTCWALLALNQIREVHTIRMPSFKFHEQFKKFRKQHVKKQKEIRNKIFESFILFFLIVLVLIVWYILDTKPDSPKNLIAWISAGISMLLLGRISILIKYFYKLK